MDEAKVFEQVKKVVVDQLGVSEGEVKKRSFFCGRSWRGFPRYGRAGNGA